MNKIPLVFCADDNYVMPTSVAIQSLLENKKKDTFYDIYILCNNISQKNKDKIIFSNFINQYEIYFIDYKLNIEQNAMNFGWSVSMFLKYFIPNLLNDLDKVIYLDGDTLILGDLTELYEYDLQGFYLGAVKSPGMNYNMASENQLWLEMDRVEYLLKFFNTGVLLINNKQLRDDNIQQKLLQVTQLLMYPPPPIFR